MAAETPAYFSPGWWESTQGAAPDSNEYVRAMRSFENWESSARRRAYDALVGAMTAAQEASRAREKAKRAYDKKFCCGSEEAIESYETLLNARARQYIRALERYRAHLAAVDAVARQAIRDAETTRAALSAVQAKLDGAAKAAEDAVAGYTGGRIEDALRLSDNNFAENEIAFAVWVGMMRGLSETLGARAQPAEPSNPCKTPKAKKKKQKASGKKKAKKKA